MHSRSSLTLVLLAMTVTPGMVVAQGGKAKTASAAVEEYIKAASDSNLKRMPELFGTDKGSAARVGLPGGSVEKRMVFTQAWLSRASVRALSEISGEKKNERIVTTEIARNGCKVVVPVVAVNNDKDGWLVRNLDLDLVKLNCSGAGTRATDRVFLRQPVEGGPLLGQFDQNAVGRPGMQEGDAMASSTGAGQVVDQLVAMTAAGGEGSIEIGNPVAEMVNPGSPLGQELRDRGVVIERFEEFDLGALELQVDNARPVGLFGSAGWERRGRRGRIASLPQHPARRRRHARCLASWLGNLTQSHRE